MHYSKSESCRKFMLKPNESFQYTRTRKGSKRKVPPDDSTQTSPSKMSSFDLNSCHPCSSFPESTVATMEEETTETFDFDLTGDEPCIDPFFADAKVNQCNIPLFQDKKIWHTKEQKALIDLMKLIMDMNAPDYAFERILEWARKNYEEGFNFNPSKGKTMKSNLDWMFKMTENAGMRLPKIVPVQVEDGVTSEVIVFDFLPSALSILQDRSKLRKEHCVLDWNNPLAKYVPPDGRIGEALSGSVYQENHHRFTNPSRPTLCIPCIGWFDRTHVTSNGRFGLQPFMITFAIFTEEYRRHLEAWMVLGYMPAHDTSSAEKGTLKPGQTLRDYHKQLGVMLESFRESTLVQNVELPIGPRGTIVCDISFTFLFIIQDMEEGDRLTGRFKPHVRGVKRQVRACNVNFENLANPQARCRYVTASQMARVAQSNNEDFRQKWSMHRLDNCFNYISFMDQKRGIFGATPSEILHCVRAGPLKEANKAVFSDLSQGLKTKLDNMARNFHKNNRQTYRKAYPSTKFTNGVTNLTLISADEHVGMMFLFVALSHFDEGWDTLDAIMRKKGKTDLAKVMATFEAILCFHAWLSLPKQWHISQGEEAMKSAQKSIRSLIWYIVNNIPKDSWLFPKLHELLHFVDDMSRFGSTANFSAQRTESLLKDTGKRVGRKAQKTKTGVVFEHQSARRYASMILVNDLHSKIGSPELFNNAPEGETDVEDQEEEEDTEDVSLEEWKNDCPSPRKEKHDVVHGTGQGTFATIYATEQDGDVQFHVRWRTSSKGDLSKFYLPDAWIYFLIDSYRKQTITICTEYRRKNMIFRCHPNYQNGGPMYDWMQVYDRKKKTTYPALLQAVVVHNEKTPQEQYELVVQPVHRETKRDSVLFKEWEVIPCSVIIDPEQVVAPVFVISIKQDMSRVIETLAVEKWPEEFTSIYADPRDVE